MDRPSQEILSALQERAKELNCLYQIDELLFDEQRPQSEVLQRVVQSLFHGWQFPEAVAVSLRFRGERWVSHEEFSGIDYLRAPIVQSGEEVGELAVCYVEKYPERDEGPFLQGERRLLNAIALRLSQFLDYRKLRRATKGYPEPVKSIASEQRSEWGVILDFLYRTDPDLLRRITRKMINHLCWQGVTGARDLLGELPGQELDVEGENRPMTAGVAKDLLELKAPTFEIARDHLGDTEIASCIQRWIREDKNHFLATALERRDSTLQEIGDALDRFQSMSMEEEELSASMRTMLRVALVQRFFTDQLDFVTMAKECVRIQAFQRLAHRIVASVDSRGKLGGKCAGLFLAMEVVEGHLQGANQDTGIRCPKSYYLPSDTLTDFMHYNDLEDLYSRRYMKVDEVRSDYPRIISLFKNSIFPQETVKGLSLLLDEMDSKPLIVRSSSLLEDRSGATFSGKYKSLFVANRGPKRERLAELLDAVAEVLASTFGPDPIEYRMDRGLLDFREEMGIMIQEVVGQEHGDYFFPAFSGVAFSRNEFRWSPRVRSEDGLLRIVPGLGTRAVDRLSDDYPVLFSLHQPDLRVSSSPADIGRYSPHYVDVINLRKRRFETLEIRSLLEHCEGRYPLGTRIFSRIDGDRISRPIGLSLNPQRDDYVATCDGLMQDPFFPQMQELMSSLERWTGAPVDLEFAHDGENLYLLQCRAQSHAGDSTPIHLPTDLPQDDIIFTALKHCSNGLVQGISHIVYVDPVGYNMLEDAAQMREIGRAISRLNDVLPKRRFILVGPGRWGSRGDILLGVPVTYSDIHNSAMLIEVARRQGNYIPDLSFGTHFFQDLVEADIRYLPLYPDEDGVVFNESFLKGGRNQLLQLAPEFAAMQSIVHVTNVPERTAGRHLNIWMSGEEDAALAGLC
ncbi:MAG: pyruvate, phosphate dikinase [Planctomycetota bacterium]|nr:MAG: pyruvate, phosphate dikinase [Planctomycetota bacterium]